MESKATIKIPRQLYNRLQDVVDQTGFDSVTDFVVFCMRDVVANKDEQSVRKRLRNLGYDL